MNKDDENKNPQPYTVLIHEIGREEAHKTGDWTAYRRIEITIEPTFSLGEASQRASAILKKTNIEAEVLKQDSQYISI